MNKGLLVLVVMIAAILAGRLAEAGIVDNGDGTATDTDTKLTWQVKGDGLLRNWEKAQSYCAELSLGGQSRWHLPDGKELFSLYEAKNKLASGSSMFPSALTSAYWTSTPYPNMPQAMYVNFSGGTAGNDGKSSPHYVHCVR